MNLRDEMMLMKLDDIIDIVAIAYGEDKAYFCGKSRSNRAAEARMIAAYLCASYSKRTYEDIANKLKYNTPSSVGNAASSISDKIQDDTRFAMFVSEMEKLVKDSAIV